MIVRYGSIEKDKRGIRAWKAYERLMSPTPTLTEFAEAVELGRQIFVSTMAKNILIEHRKGYAIQPAVINGGLVPTYGTENVKFGINHSYRWVRGRTLMYLNLLLYPNHRTSLSPQKMVLYVGSEGIVNQRHPPQSGRGRYPLMMMSRCILISQQYDT